MKILFIAPGASLHTLRWVERAKESGFEVLLFAQDNVVPETQLQVLSLSSLGFVEKNNPISNLIQNIKVLKRVISEHKPDAIHLHWLFSPIALASSFMNGTPKIGTPWGSDILQTVEKKNWSLKQRKIYETSVKRVVRKIDYFTCDANHLKERLIELGASRDRIEIIYFGTDANTFNKIKRSTTFRLKCNVKEDDIYILSNRNFYKVYDIPTILKAFALIKNRFTNVQLVLGGSGPEKDSIIQEASNLGILNSITYLGFQNDEDFVQSVASADIYVSTSTSDGGLASSIAEAMACEVPVVATNFGENAFWILNGPCGHIFEISNYYELAKILAELIEDKNRRLAMGKKGRELVESSLNPKVEANKLKHLYFAVNSNVN